MAVTQNNYTGDGSTVLFSFTFPYLTTTDVKVKLDGVNTTAYSLANATTVQLNSAPANGVKIIIFRNTDNDNKKATFYPGSAIKAEDLNNNIDQILYVAQEVDNNAMSSLGDTPMQGDLEMGQGMGIVFEGSTTDDFETRLAVANPTADRTVTLPNVTGTVVTTGDTGTVTSAMITDATIVNADINASAAIAQSKLNIANATTSAAGYESAADKTKLDGIETAATADQTAAEIRTLVESATDSNVFTDADHSKLNAIEASATADQTAAEIRTLVGNASNSNVFTDAESTKLAGIEAGATEDQTASEIKTLIASSPLDASHLAANSVGDSEIATGALDNRYYTETESDARYFNVSTGDTIKDGDTFPDNDTTIATTAAINDRIIDLVDDVGGFVPIANETSFPNANPDVNNGTGTLVSIKALSSNLTSNGSGVATIANGTVGNSTVTINGLANSTTYNAGFGILVETTTTLNTYTFHRQVPIATEVSTVAGSISNVNSVASNISNVNSVAGNASNINSTVSNASNINTVAGSISNVNTVSTNISSVNDFADKYRIASSAPGSNNDDGDLYYNTSDNKLYVYNGSAWEVAASLNGSGGSVTGDTTFADSTKLKLGTGEDLEIYHNGTNSYITNATGGLNLASADGLPIQLIGGTNLAETMATFTDNGAVELYYDNVKKAETYSNGFKINGQLQCEGDVKFDNPDNAGRDVRWDSSDDTLEFSDNTKAGFGNDLDLQIYHDASNSYIRDTGTGALYVDGSSVRFRNYANSNTMAQFIGDGQCELYYNNSKKFETNSAGVQVTGQLEADEVYLRDSEKLLLGTGSDLQISSAGTGGLIKTTTGALTIATASLHVNNAADSEQCIHTTENGSVELFYDDSKKFETTSAGVLTSGNSYVNDDNKFIAGTGNDLQIYHDALNSYVKNSTGWLVLGDGGSGTVIKGATGENAIACTANGAVEIYHDNVLKLVTDTAGERGSVECKAGKGSDWDGYSIGGYYAFLANNRGNADTVLIYNDLDNEVMFSGTRGGATKLYYDGVEKLYTSGSGVVVTGLASSGNITLGDSIKTIWGDGEDLQIYHNGTNSFVYNATGGLYLKSTNNAYIQVADGEEALRATANGAVELKYDNSSKLATASFGINVIGDARWGDGRKATFGNDGTDLQIYHDGSDSYITDSGTGKLRLLTDSFRVSNAANSENLIAGEENGSVSLFYDNSTKLETKSWGVEIPTNQGLIAQGSSAYIKVQDSGKFYAGDNEDLQVYHDGTNTQVRNQTGSLLVMSDTYDLRSWSSNETMIKGVLNGAVELYNNGVKTFSTTTNAAIVWGSEGNNASLHFHADEGDDWADYWNFNAKTDGSFELQCRNDGSGFEDVLKADRNGKVALYYDNSKKFETTAGGTIVTGTLNTTGTITGGGHIKTGSDSGYFLAGASNDLKIYHDGTNSYIDSNQGELRLIGSNGTIRIRPTDAENSIVALPNAGAELYYDNSKKLDTRSWGVQIEGGLILNTDSEKLYLGAGNDLTLEHNGTDSKIFNHTGVLRINADDIYLKDKNEGDMHIKCEHDGLVRLYYDGATRVTTTADGVDVAGLLYVNRTSTVARFKVNTSGDVDGIEMRHMRGGLAGYSGKMVSFRGNDNTEEGTIHIGQSSTSYGTSSDYRLKENQVNISDGITRLKQLKPYRFNFKKYPDTTVDGFFAHEVTPTVPEAITGDKDATNSDGSIKPQNIDQSKLVPLLTAALQEAIAKIETLETKVAALESS